MAEKKATSGGLYGPIIDCRFRMEALGVGLASCKEEQVSDSRQSRSQLGPRTSMSAQPTLRPRTETMKASQLQRYEPKRTRSFSDPGFLASLSAELTWAAENETNTDFLKSMSIEPEPIVSEVGGSKEMLWTEDHSVAYVLEVRKDGSVSFQIRKGMLRSIVEQIVLWLVRPPGSSKSSIQAVKSQLEYFLCAHERVISTQELLFMLYEISVKPDDNGKMIISMFNPLNP